MTPSPPSDPLADLHARCLTAWTALIEAHTAALSPAAEPNWPAVMMPETATRERDLARTDCDWLADPVCRLLAAAEAAADYPAPDPFMGREAVHAARRAAELLRFSADTTLVPIPPGLTNLRVTGLLEDAHATRDFYPRPLPVPERWALVLRQLFARTYGLSVANGIGEARRVAAAADARLRTLLAVERGRASRAAVAAPSSYLPPERIDGFNRAVVPVGYTIEGIEEHAAGIAPPQTVGALVEFLRAEARRYLEGTAAVERADAAEHRRAVAVRDAHQDIQLRVLGRANGIEALRTAIRRLFDSDLTAAVLNRAVGELLRTGQSATLAEAEGLSLTEASRRLTAPVVDLAELEERDRNILVALLEFGATGKDRRTTTDELATRAEGCTANAET